MEIFKELFVDGDDFLVCSGGNVQSASDEGKFSSLSAPPYQGHCVHSAGEQPVPLSTPLPLLPTESDIALSRSQSLTSCRQARPKLSSHSQESTSDHSHRDNDIRDVPTEMPMYLLAEDEGNEEEILRLLETASPSRDVVTCAVGSPQAGERVPSDSVISVGKGKHGGGWPKGRSRKAPGTLLAPKPPATGYGLYLSENKTAVQHQCGTKSMSILSRRLGKMWSELDTEQKNAFYSQAKSDRVRYLDELRKYLADCYKGINLEKANSIISRSFEGETDDKIFVCDLCELHFTSLFNKQSHYSGKLHLQTLLQHLNQVVSEADEEHSPNASKSLCDNQQGPSLSLSKSLRDMAKHWDNCAENILNLRVNVKMKLELNATLQQTLKEAEYFRLHYSEILANLKRSEGLVEQKLHYLLQVLMLNNTEIQLKH